ncbi:probable protein arginine N-methyltransferase 3 isoform X2 [Cucurbita maxima]|uniref:Probable protein arginine N-methyltransferase 3 isoform X2 n=1 Tax=Cucurbita maxima TaxID=3661 RepID=A0A6J1HTS9_CUCMA|nr:probable protein arginine N-methyltransferase 3 isoform X2 [Cucurbita maxima]
MDQFPKELDREVCNMNKIERKEEEEEEEDEEEEEEDVQDDWDDWNADEEEGEEGFDLNFLCLFCTSKYNDCATLFNHCNSVHNFDFHGIRKALGLDFYGSFKIINYIRSQVAENRCWSCGFLCQSSQDLQNHLHQTLNLNEIKALWNDDKYLKPFSEDDPILYSFAEDEEDDDISPITNNLQRNTDSNCDCSSTSHGYLNTPSNLEAVIENTVKATETLKLNDKTQEDDQLKITRRNFYSKDIKNVNESYFGSYSSFGIHREMLSDKVRMDAYMQAILQNPSLFHNAAVMDVGCGTGILSLFAAKAGASRVIAVEASEKMAAVATQIAKDNGLLRNRKQTGDCGMSSGTVEVVNGMVEELDKNIEIQPHSVDVLLSEWMGYCLLYESMLSSVLFARDRWLKPGGAILPDTATILVAGFGIGGTSLPFWENVYGFNMSCVGKELVEDAAKGPIVDTVEANDLVTSAAILHTFDLATMHADEVDFTASTELEPNLHNPSSKSENVEVETSWCHGVVLWFETGFTSRFCKESPAVLSTSPYTPKTHWSQTILTFREPIAITSSKSTTNKSATVGSFASPAVKVHLRLSIVRAPEHRSIDISLETTGIASDGRKHHWPVQLFTLR